jgi:hypothetical protein
MDLFLLDRKYMFLEDDHREAVCRVERLQQELEESRRRSDFAILILRNQLKEKTRNPHGVKLRPTEEELELEAVERRNSSSVIMRNLDRQQQQRTLNSVSKLLRARERRRCGGTLTPVNKHLNSAPFTFSRNLYCFAMQQRIMVSVVILQTGAARIGTPRQGTVR